MVLHDPIPDLKGSICTALVRQEYWYQGELDEQAHILYLQVDNIQWHRFLIDQPVLFWKVVNSPDEWNTKPNDEYHYPQYEIAASSGLYGRVIEGMEISDEPTNSRLQIRFSGGARLVLQSEGYHSTLAIVTDAETGAV